MRRHLEAIAGLGVRLLAVLAGGEHRLVGGELLLMLLIQLLLLGGVRVGVAKAFEFVASAGHAAETALPGVERVLYADRSAALANGCKLGVAERWQLAGQIRRMYLRTKGISHET